MTVVFSNTSKGINNSYTWNFGDGSPQVTSSTAGQVSHIFYAGVQDTFFVRLIAVNECGADTLRYAIVVSPNAVVLDFAVNGNELSGCAPHTVHFINNSSGATSFAWNFGNGNTLNTTQNIDTVIYTYLVPGTYVVNLHATNGCSDTSTTETITVFAKPTASFTLSTYIACVGEQITCSNASTGASSYLWDFGDGITSSLAQPVHSYAAAGIYLVKLKAFNQNANGITCIDSLMSQVIVSAGLPGWFTASDTLASCAPLTVNFVNMNAPSATAVWNFDDGGTGTGNNVTHTFTQAGIYQVTLVATAAGGCVYTTTRTIKVLGPTGTLSYTHGFVCNNNTATFQVQANNATGFQWNFGDGVVLSTTTNVVTHTYANGGAYIPTVTLVNAAGCQIPLTGIDTIKVDKIKAGFAHVALQSCGFTSIQFTDTTHAFFGNASVLWDFGDNTTGSGPVVIHNYQASGNYTIRLIVNGNSGCADTLFSQVQVAVKNRPVAGIAGDTTACTGQPATFTASIQTTDAINFIKWTTSTGVTGSNTVFSASFTLPGIYTVQLIAGTVNGCYDTTVHTLKVNPAPFVNAGNDVTICLGNSTTLNAIGTTQYSWSPLQGLSCTTCASPVASPVVTTPYVVKGTNSFGCSAFDTLVVTVIQPLHMQVAPGDSICIGQSANLLASGATLYSWTPAATLNNPAASNPVATPTATTIYRVVGYDGFSCFTDTAFVTIGVGQYPLVALGPDLVLSTGTLQPLNTLIQNGPVQYWQWTPATDLSCATCPLPIAHVKKDISYTVTVTTFYGCSATDTIRISTFCESAQVFIPNAFTPDGDGVNDVLMVRAKGIAMVKTFRVFNRWGEVVFERSSFAPNSPLFGWDGRIKGVQGPPDVFVYTAEVVCENGSTYTYKGNVSILK
jgi:gliding motility-associated-like protein